MPFELSHDAQQDLIGIYETGIREFGIVQSDKYLTGIEKAFAFLAEFPRAARERAELPPGSRAYPYRSHLIVYRIEGDGILVQRVRHGREDWIDPAEA